MLCEHPFVSECCSVGEICPSDIINSIIFLLRVHPPLINCMCWKSFHIFRSGVYWGLMDNPLKSHMDFSLIVPEQIFTFVFITSFHMDHKLLLSQFNKDKWDLGSIVICHKCFCHLNMFHKNRSIWKIFWVGVEVCRAEYYKHRTSLYKLSGLTTPYTCCTTPYTIGLLTFKLHWTPQHFQP